MPHYYFDIHDDVHLIDEVGQDLPNLRAARAEAARALAEAAKELAALAPSKDFVILVRNEGGEVVLRTRMSFSSEPAF